MEYGVVRNIEDALVGLRVFVYDGGEKIFGTISSVTEEIFFVDWDDGERTSYVPGEHLCLYVEPEPETYAIIINDEIYARNLTKDEMIATINVRLSSGGYDVYYTPMKALKKISIRVKTETIIDFEE